MAVSETSAGQVSSVSSPNTQRLGLRPTIWIIVVLAIVKLALHLFLNGRYGYFRDELWYIDCSRHLDWGYVDQPPVIALTVRLSHILLGDSLQALRFPATLAGIAVIVLALLIVRELGGKKLAMWLTGICLFVGGIWLSLSYLMTMNIYEHVIWTACAYCVIRYMNTRNQKYWLWFGVLAGIGLETKYSVGVFGVAIVVGLLLTRERKVFLSKWIWLGGVLAFLIFLPNLLWNIHYRWPFVELIRNINAEGRDVVLSPLQFMLQQAVIISPISYPVCIAGAVWLFFSERGKRYRMLGWTFLTILLFFMITHGKHYYVAPIYPMLLAAGAVAIETWLNTPKLRWIGWAYAAAIVVFGAIFAPLSIPLLPVDTYLKYQAAMPIKVPVTEHSHAAAALPQIYADQFGWPEIVEATTHAWREIPPDEQKDCAIFAQDYGSAGAIDFLGGKNGLPKVISGDRSYWLWGPRGYSGNCMIVLDDRREQLQELFERVELITISEPNPYALEQQLPVYMCREAKFGSLEKLWPAIKHWR
jgi:4-amino-4-deoxy-L-arabinose transferase-like glycosyltransferase